MNHMLKRWMINEGNLIETHSCSLLSPSSFPWIARLYRWLFCLKSRELSLESRLHSYASKDSLKRHVHRCRLNFLKNISTYSLSSSSHCVRWDHSGRDCALRITQQGCTRYLCNLAARHESKATACCTRQVKRASRNIVCILILRKLFLLPAENGFQKLCEAWVCTISISYLLQDVASALLPNVMISSTPLSCSPRVWRVTETTSSWATSLCYCCWGPRLELFRRCWNSWHRHRRSNLSTEMLGRWPCSGSKQLLFSLRDPEAAAKRFADSWRLI